MPTYTESNTIIILFTITKLGAPPYKIFRIIVNKPNTNAATVYGKVDFLLSFTKYFFLFILI